MAEEGNLVRERKTDESAETAASAMEPPNVSQETSNNPWPPFGASHSHPHPANRQYRSINDYARNALQPWLSQHCFLNHFYTMLPFYSMAFTMPPFSGQMPAGGDDGLNGSPPGFPMGFTQPNAFTGRPGDNGMWQSNNARGAANRLQQESNAAFRGTEFRLPTFWKRVAAELIDFTFLFYIKLLVTMLVMQEMGIMTTTLDYTVLLDLGEIDYDKAFAITSEVIAVEIVNRLLITIFETLCLRSGVGVVGGATPGKRLLGLKVVSCHDVLDLGGERVLVAPAGNMGWTSAFVRSAIKNFTIAFFFPACLTIFMFRHNRAAYDVVAGTIVVQADDNEEA